MSDAAPLADTQKSPPADQTNHTPDIVTTTDSTSNQTDAASGKGTTSWLMAEVHGEWDSLKKTLGISSDPAKGTEDGTVDVPNIFHPADKSSTNGAPPAGAVDAAPPAAAATAPTSDAAASASANQAKGAVTDGGATEKASPTTAATPEHHWWDGITSAAHTVAGYVAQGWDALSDKVDDTYKSVLNDSDNKTTHVEAKLGSDGKPEYFTQTNDNGTRTLSATEERFTDAKGATIIKDTKTGEITSQSADGEDIYTRKADGTEVYRSKDIEYTKNKDGTYEARDDKGNVTEISDKGAITQIDCIFKVAQRITSIDETTAKPEKGQLETMTDGQRYMDHRGNLVVARDNGVREITTTDGQHYRVDRDHQQIEIEENGQWRTLSKEEFVSLHNGHIDQDDQGKNTIEVGGVKVGADGKVTTEDKVTVGQSTPDGKMVATVPTESGKPAVVTNNPDHTSSLALDGHITKVNPSDHAHLVQRFSENSDGSQGAAESNYDSDDNTFWTPDLTWSDNGTYLGWSDTYIDPSGGLFSSDGSSIFDDSPYAQQVSSTQTTDTCQNADSVVASVASKLGSHNLESGDLSVLSSSLSDLDGALNVAMSSGNFDAACQLMQAKGEVSTAIAEAAQQVVANKTQEDQLTKDQTFEGGLAYMSGFSITGINDDQEKRLTA